MDLDQSVNQILRLDKRFLTDGNFDGCPANFERKITRVLLERERERWCVDRERKIIYVSRETKREEERKNRDR